MALNYINRKLKIKIKINFQTNLQFSKVFINKKDFKKKKINMEDIIFSFIFSSFFSVFLLEEKLCDDKIFLYFRNFVLFTCYNLVLIFLNIKNIMCNFLEATNLYENTFLLKYFPIFHFFLYLLTTSFGSIIISIVYTFFLLKIKSKLSKIAIVVFNFIPVMFILILRLSLENQNNFNEINENISNFDENTKKEEKSFILSIFEFIIEIFLELLQ